MRRMKCCPKCGSTNINPLVFYRPSTWKCLDCGYEGAFIIENSDFAEQVQGHRGRCNIVNRVEEDPRIDHWGGSTDNWQKMLEDHVKTVATDIKDNNYVGCWIEPMKE